MKKRILLLAAFVAGAFSVTQAQQDAEKAVPYFSADQVKETLDDATPVSDLTTFQPLSGNYTIEIQGTAGAEITFPFSTDVVASYTPEATGTVRFVARYGNVFVYEGKEYKGPVNRTDPEVEANQVVGITGATEAKYVEGAAYAPAIEGEEITNDYLENAAVTSTNKWTNGKTDTKEPFTDAPDKTYLNVWNQSSTSIYQEVTLPAGVYKLKVATRGSTSVDKGTANIYVSKNGSNLNSRGVNKDGNSGGDLGNGWSWTDVDFTNLESSKLRIGFWANCGSNKWASADDFHLLKVRDLVDADFVPSALAALKEQLDAYDKLNTTQNVGENVFQIPTSAVTALKAVYDAAKTIYEAEEHTSTAINEQTDALKAAIETYQATPLNKPKEGQLYNIINISEGFNSQGKALTFTSSKDADLTQYTTKMNWSDEAGSIYPQAVAFESVEDKLNGYIISYTRADGKIIYVTTESKTGLGDRKPERIRPTNDKAKALTIVIEVAGDKQWRLWNTQVTSADKYIGANKDGDATDNGCYTSSDKYGTVAFQEAAETNYTLTVQAENQYGTLIVPFDTDVPEGAKVYTITGYEEGATLTLKPAETIKANTPYVVEAKEGEGINDELSGLGNAYTDETYGEGWLTGAYTEQLAPTDSYVLQNQDGVVAFYKVSAADPIMVPANKAYLTVPAEAAGRNAFFFDGEATAIHNVVNAFTSGNVEVYNASGVRQNGLQKGLNIIRTKDGSTHKVMVK